MDEEPVDKHLTVVRLDPCSCVVLVLIRTAAGTRGTLIQIRPAAVTVDPGSGTTPTGYLILNVTTGHIERHAGGYVL